MTPAWLFSANWRLLTGGCQQEQPAVDCCAALKKQNLSCLWNQATIYHVGGKAVIGPFTEPLGFISPAYQRFYLHYTTVCQNAINPYLYHMAGKTRIKNNICAFTGTLAVRRA